MRILDKQIGPGYPVFVIAEVGINHNGSLDIAKALIRAAADAGANGVKFQTRTLTSTFTQEELRTPRKVDPTILQHGVDRGVMSANFDPTNPTNGDLKTALEFTLPEFVALKAFAEEQGLVCLSSPWDLPAVDFLEKAGVSCYKVAGARVRHKGLLRAIHRTGKPVFLSTGMSTYSEVGQAVDELGISNLILMYCRSVYPAPPNILNLQAIPALQDKFGDRIGYSGHEIGIATTIAAVALGAVAVERHLTLDRHMPGSDHSSSIGPSEFAEMVKGIREVEQALGTGEISMINEELPARGKLDKTADIGDEVTAH